MENSSFQFPYNNLILNPDALTERQNRINPTYKAINMDMHFSPTSSRLLYFPPPNTQQTDDWLYSMLEQADKSALIASLNSGSFSQETLHSLLYTAWSAGQSGVTGMMCETRSYTLTVLAHIVVDALRKEQEEFVSGLLKEEFVRENVVDTALHIIEMERGINPDHYRLLTEKLIDLAAHSLSADETAVQIAHAPDSLSNIAPENKMDIGQLLGIPDLLRYGQVSRDFNKAMQGALQNRTTSILAPALTAPAMVILRKVRCLDFKVLHATDAKMPRIGQLTNLHTLDLSNTHVTDAGLFHLNNLPTLHTLNLRETNVTDAGLFHLNNLPTLHTLNLCETKVTDAGLLHLNNLPTLHTLGLT